MGADAKEAIQAQLDNISVARAGWDAAEAGKKRGQEWANAFASTAVAGITTTQVAKTTVNDAGGGLLRGGATTPTATSAAATAKGSGPAQVAVNAAASPGANAAAFHLPGERGPYDCSAFVEAVYKNSGLPSPGTTTYQQIARGRSVSMNDLQPGDLVFFNYGSETWPGHVAMYVGGGMVVHDHGASRGVEQQSLSSLSSSSNHTPAARCYIASHKHGAAATSAAAPTPTAASSAAPPTSGATTKKKATTVSTRGI
jgi:cell wall-associated NlpC family hydrolase